MPYWVVEKEVFIKGNILDIEDLLSTYFKETEDIQKLLFDLNIKYQDTPEKLNDEDYGKLEDIENSIESILFFVYKETEKIPHTFDKKNNSQISPENILNLTAEQAADVIQTEMRDIEKEKLEIE